MVIRESSREKLSPEWSGYPWLYMFYAITPTMTIDTRVFQESLDKPCRSWSSRCIPDINSAYVLHPLLLKEGYH